jgi:hypothetical protein
LVRDGQSKRVAAGQRGGGGSCWGKVQRSCFQKVAERQMDIAQFREVGVVIA